MVTSGGGSGTLPHRRHFLWWDAAEARTRVSSNLWTTPVDTRGGRVGAPYPGGQGTNVSVRNSAIARDDVAAGEGALRTHTTRPWVST